MERKEAIEVVKKNYPHVNVSGSQFETALRTLIPELKESEDERIRKDIISYLALYKDAIGEEYESWIAWLEKQCEHANFRNNIQIGDKVTRNKDGVLVNLSQLNRVAKKQGEQPKKHDVCDNCDQQGSCVYPCPMKLVENQGEQKPTWSEEEEKIVEHLINLYKVNLKVNHYPDLEVNKKVNELKMFFKSLRPQSTWKPTEQQMKVLNEVINFAADHGTIRK